MLNAECSTVIQFHNSTECIIQLALVILHNFAFSSFPTMSCYLCLKLRKYTQVYTGFKQRVSTFTNTPKN